MNTAFRMKSTGHGSDYYGPCEVCHKHCSETFILVESRGFSNPETGMMEYTYAEAAPIVFGHKECLTEKTQQEEVSNPLVAENGPLGVGA
jgi:hypothetical protein